ncbi:vWA domain-containing protein [Vibrio chaetopteri]|uniref:vWA domain-containing protein n=1 Tax=Vibrio chaetopteri TaxID=3016528 RepID=UPI003AB52D6A
MRKKSREINIFSMSALDLFASGMGAFLLLAVISLPFFGNTSRTEPSPVQCPQVKECPLPAPPRPVPPIPAPPVPVPPGIQKGPPVDVVLVLDVTGSMQERIESLKSEARGLTMLLGRFSDSARLAIVAFGDDGFSRPSTTYNFEEVTNVTAIQTNVNRIKVDIGVGGGGNTLPGEAVYAGFNAASDLSWRADTHRKIIIITDDAPHETQVKPLLSATQAFASVSDTYSVDVMVLNNNTQLIEYYKQLAINSNGIYINGAMHSVTSAVILSIVDSSI